jgi:hypothetical protein
MTAIKSGKSHAYSMHTLKLENHSNLMSPISRNWDSE